MCVKKSALRGNFMHFAPLRRPARGAVLLNDVGAQLDSKTHGWRFCPHIEFVLFLNSSAAIDFV